MTFAFVTRQHVLASLAVLLGVSAALALGGCTPDPDVELRNQGATMVGTSVQLLFTFMVRVYGSDSVTFTGRETIVDAHGTVLLTRNVPVEVPPPGLCECLPVSLDTSLFPAAAMPLTVQVSLGSASASQVLSGLTAGSASTLDCSAACTR